MVLAAGALSIWALWVELTYLHPFWRVVAARHGLYVATWGGTALAAFGTGTYAAARAMGLGAVGRKVDVTEQAIRRGEGQDPALGEALARHDAGDYE